MRIAFFCNIMPDPCGAFFHDVILARGLQARGHSVIFVVIGAKFPRNGIYRGIPFFNYEIAGKELERTDIWSTPHNPILAQVRKINETFEKPLVVNMHYGEDTRHIVKAVRHGNWAEFLWYVSDHVQSKVESIPISPTFVERRVFNPAFIENELTMPVKPQGDCITLINANFLKGLFVFVEMAKHFPDRKFLGVRPYYSAVAVPNLPNIEWMDIQDDIRKVLERTRILLVPSIYESWGRVAFEAMYNSIPVLYTKPSTDVAVFSSGSTEGMAKWIGDNGFACDRNKPDDWITNIQKLDDPDIYKEYSDKAYACTHNMGAFNEIPTVEAKFSEYIVKYAAPKKTKGEEAPAVQQRGGVNRFISGVPQQRPAPRASPQQIPQPQPQPQPRMSFGLRGGRFGMRR
jgi:glycosyltransferase involved in cell wall biosynthesis